MRRLTIIPTLLWAGLLPSGCLDRSPDPTGPAQTASGPPDVADSRATRHPAREGGGGTPGPNCIGNQFGCPGPVTYVYGVVTCRSLAANGHPECMTLTVGNDVPGRHELPGYEGNANIPSFCIVADGPDSWCTLLEGP